MRRSGPEARDAYSIRRKAAADDEQRRQFLFNSFNLIIGSVSLFMTVVNIFTDKRLLMWSTLIFAVVCGVNLLLSRLGERTTHAAHYLFILETLALCTFFCISGTPEGFSALWTCFIPSFALTMLGARKGSAYSGVAFLMIVFVFWTPWGRSLLQYEYTDSFMLRFPMIYAAFYAMALFLEIIRAETQRQLVLSQQNYQFLYRHDALTGLYNRYGFNEEMDAVFSAGDDAPLALLMVDLDLFKSINDTYGHDKGDEALRLAAGILQEVGGPKGKACRWGGEEFTLLLQDCPDPEGAAEQIRARVEAARIPAGEQEVRFTVSIGRCPVADRRAVSIAQVVTGADKCLYSAKAAGRDQVVGMHL